MANFTGVQVAEEVDAEVVAALMTSGYLPISRAEEVLSAPLFPNSFAILRSEIGEVASRISPNGEKLLLIKDSQKASGVKARSLEQAMLMSTLLDDRIPVQIIAGRAGTGKTLLTLAAAMHKVDDGTYDKIILTKPMSQVGEYDLGILPGTVEDKFAPFLINYASNVEQLFGGFERREKTSKESRSKRGAKHTAHVDGLPAPKTGMQAVMATFFNQYNVEMVPMQLLRGASLHRAFIIADEIQVLGHHEMLTLGTRVAEGSKLVLMGDLNQRDEKIAKSATGLYKTINSDIMKSSSLVSYIELLKVERGPVAELFTKVFEPSAS